MRAHRLPAFTAVAMFVASLVACGLDSAGLLVVDGGADTVNGLGTDAAASSSDDATASVTPTPVDEADTSIDAASVTHPTPVDASAPVQADSASVGDVAVDAPFTCGGCTAQTCPKELAACGSGSDCLAYRDCAEACTGTSSASCTKSCEAMYTAGEVAFAALTICDLNCGAGCVAGLTVGTP
jgi:hypothetical protein